MTWKMTMIKDARKFLASGDGHIYSPLGSSIAWFGERSHPSRLLVQKIIYRSQKVDETFFYLNSTSGSTSEIILVLMWR